MSDWIIAIVAFVGVLLLLVIARLKTQTRFEIKSPDIVLALIPIALWLFLTGKVTTFEYGDLKIESAFMAASAAPVAAQVAEQKPLPVQPIQPFAKGDIGQIPALIDRQAKALSFQLGHGGYVGSAIERYLRELTQYPFLKHVVFLNRDGTFLGISDAAGLGERLGHELDSQRLADWLNADNRSEIERLPGFISAAEAVKQDARRDVVLEAMEKLQAESLPVIDEDGRFVGVVERGRITAAMLIEISKELEAR